MPGKPIRTTTEENILVTVQGSKLLLTIDLEAEGKPSESGKTLLVATTRGSMPVVDGLMLNLNLYRKKSS